MDHTGIVVENSYSDIGHGSNSIALRKRKLLYSLSLQKIRLGGMNIATGDMRFK